MSHTYFWKFKLSETQASIDPSRLRDSKQGVCILLTCFAAVQVDWKRFSDLRQQVNEQWHALPKTADVLSKPLKERIATVTQRLRS